MALAAVALALALPGAGAAGDDDEHEDESVTRVSCVGGTAELRLQADGGDDDDDDDDERGDRIEIVLRMDVRRPVAVWRLVLLHERRIVYQGMRSSIRFGYGLRYERTVPDWYGRQTVAARLTTGDGRTCRIEATI